MRRYLQQPTFLLKTKSRQHEEMKSFHKSRTQAGIMFVRFSKVRGIGSRIVMNTKEE